MAISIGGTGFPERARELGGNAAGKTAHGDFSAKLRDALKGDLQAFDSLFIAAGRAFGIDPALLKAVARAESGLNPRAVSPAGALGIMQLMPATARALGVKDPFDPLQSIFGGARYLRYLLDRFGGDVRLALAAYNAGPGAVQRWGGVPPYRETREYVERVLGYLKQDDGTGTFASDPGSGTTPQENAGDLTSFQEMLKMWGDALMLEALLEIASSPDEEG
ncbi:MAG: lytic transglycosylase domain-containing protein [Thermacetogeniaceae bacterium]